MERLMFTLLLLFAAASALPAPSTADDAAVKWLRQQLPIWCVDDKAQFEGPELILIKLDLKLYDQTQDPATKDALELLMIDDWHALEAVDDLLDTRKVI